MAVTPKLEVNEQHFLARARLTQHTIGIQLFQVA